MLDELAERDTEAEAIVTEHGGQLDPGHRGWLDHTQL
jgi:hypothetical protein